MKANVSLCMIVRDEEAGLARCLQSARPYVDQIVVVDTGSTDRTPAIALELADTFTTFTECNDPATGLIRDFSLARNHSFALAKHPWVLWLDGDDELIEGELLEKLTAYPLPPGKAAAMWAIPYEYDHDAQGNCTCLQERERLIHPASQFRWTQPIHETLGALQPHTYSARSKGVPGVEEKLRVTHRHDPSKAAVREPGRNLRILEAWYAQHGEADARNLFYFGRELSYAGQPERAIQILTRYVELSGWDEEQCLACMRLAELYQQAPCVQADGKTLDVPKFRQNHRLAIDWGLRAIAMRERWGEAYFCVARCFFALASQSQSRREWERCAHFAAAGLDCPPTDTMLFHNPRDRQVEIHRVLNIALNHLGKIDSALISVSAALQHAPDDLSLQLNKRVYERFLARGRVIDGLAELQGHGMAPTTFARVMAMVDGPQPEPASAEWGDVELARRAFPADGLAVAGAPVAAPTPIGEWLPYHRPADYPRGVTAADFVHPRVSPHAQAWAIPETVVLDDLPLDTTAGQVLATTILLWKEYLLHDEVLAAERLLADAPYRIKHNASIQRALRMTRATFAWMSDPQGEQQYNAPEDPTVETGVPLPGPLSRQLLGRMQVIQARVRPGERVLDFGCSDGSIANRLALTGMDVTGVDLCKTSVDLAQQKAAEFSTGARFLCCKFSELLQQMTGNPGVYDVVVSTDTYEHVIDPLRDMLLPAKHVLRDTGRAVLCTPYGAWMRGQFVWWAHPWRWAPEKGAAWNAPIERAHLVAPTPWTVAENLRKAGFYVYDSYAELCEVQDVPEQGNVIAEGRVTAPRCETGAPLDVVIACPAYSYEPWTPHNLQRGGIGGSETAVIEVARRLAARGHRVRVYGTPGPHGAGVYQGVEYRQAGRLVQLPGGLDPVAATEELDLVESCDLYIAWRYAELLDHVPQAKRRWLWVHDVYAHNATPERLVKADRILALSDWHRGFMAGHHGLPLDRFTITRNGIDLARFEHDVPRDPHKVVNSSSPDRSWPALLQLWPQVRAAVPDATLHLFYGFTNWEKTTDPGQLATIAQLKARIAELEPQGVVLRGRVDQQTLAREFLSAGVLAFPTWFTETSCVTAMEAQAAGLSIVTSALAALNETVGERGTLLQGDWLSAEYQRQFVDGVLAAMETSEEARRELQQYARDHFSWDGVAAQWVQWIRADLEAPVDTGPRLAPYVAAQSFRRTR